MICLSISDLQSQIGITNALLAEPMHTTSATTIHHVGTRDSSVKVLRQSYTCRISLGPLPHSLRKSMVACHGAAKLFSASSTSSWHRIWIQACWIEGRHHSDEVENVQSCLACLGADDGLVLGFEGLPGDVAVDNSQFTNLPGFVIVSNSTMRFNNVTFSQCNTNGAGSHPLSLP